MCKMSVLLLRVRTLKLGGVRNWTKHAQLISDRKVPHLTTTCSNPKPWLASTMANLTDVTILPKADPGRFDSSFWANIFLIGKISSYQSCKGKIPPSLWITWTAMKLYGTVQGLPVSFLYLRGMETACSQIQCKTQAWIRWTSSFLQDFSVSLFF